ncbi:related to pyridoxal kinase [Cephalotrichum gorgonifer]|uniref:pyridoxal kinase n=1 Tax=Cephalotrichum gorgonifer TaxID=2041049 RepID=A0AAE8MVI2_9PEZI|nr:related to pyridoxal kinase [Cephalotrichum gorgonifer]
MADEFPVPETRVLAVASHVVSGNVGNKIAVFVLQSLGCDVAALNTVQFSNHTGYGQWKGSRVSAEEITDLYQGLKQSYLDEFHMMLTGYIPGAAAVNAVGAIAKELRAKAEQAPEKFFWVLDPVMGDHGRIYVAEDVVPAYRSLIPYADLILPNQFEAELLSEVKITDMETLQQAVHTLHDKFSTPHIIITSVNFNSSTPPTHLTVVGSTMTSTREARLFKITFPAIDCYFSGTGDMFAALTVVRMREAVHATPGLDTVPSWISDDSVDALDLPLARAVERVIGSMHEVLSKTSAEMKQALEGITIPEDAGQARLAKSKAAELRLVRNLSCLRSPSEDFKAVRI